MALTQEQKNSILRFQAEGLGGRKIAEELDVSYGQVRYFLENLQGAVEVAPLRAVVFDLETSSLKSDIGTLLVAAFLDLNTGKVESRTILDFPGRRAVEKEGFLLDWTIQQIEDADILIGHNVLAFDSNFLRGVLLRHGRGTLPRRFYIDTLSVARYGGKFIPQSYSLANLADILGVGEKDRPSKHEWRGANLLDPDDVKAIEHRCISDVLLNAQVWEKLKPYWFEWRGR